MYSNNGNVFLKRKKNEGDLVCLSLLVNECNNPKLTVFDNDISGKEMCNNLALIELKSPSFHFFPRQMLISLCMLNHSIGISKFRSPTLYFYMNVLFEISEQHFGKR